MNKPKPNAKPKTKSVGVAGKLGQAANVAFIASLLYEAGKAIRSASPLDPKNQAAARRNNPKLQPLPQMTAAQNAKAVRLGENAPPAPVLPKAPRSPSIGAPIHASPQSFGTGSAYVGSSAATPQRPSTPAQAALQGAPASETYRDGGKGLYQGTQAYRDAVGGSGNPLLNKMRTELGRDTATGAKTTPTQPNAQYDGNDEPGRLGQAEDPYKALGELLNRRKLSITVEH